MFASRPTAPVLLALVLALASGLVLATPAEAAKWKPKLSAKPAQEAVQAPSASAAASVPTGKADAGKGKAKLGASSDKANSGKAKSGKTRMAQAHGSSGDSTATELPTGGLGFHNATAADKDCFVVKKRTLVPGTGYMIRRSTFCN